MKWKTDKVIGSWVRKWAVLPWYCPKCESNVWLGKIYENEKTDRVRCPECLAMELLTESDKQQREEKDGAISAAVMQRALAAAAAKAQAAMAPQRISEQERAERRYQYEKMLEELERRVAVDRTKQYIIKKQPEPYCDAFEEPGVIVKHGR